MRNISFFLLLICFCSCSGLKLKLKNGTNQNFKKVTVHIGNKKYCFDNLRSGEKTTIIKVKGSYHYFPTEIITENDTITASAFCYTGEKFYKSGNLVVTLKIEKSDNENFIDFEASR